MQHLLEHCALLVWLQAMVRTSCVEGYHDCILLLRSQSQCVGRQSVVPGLSYFVSKIDQTIVNFSPQRKSKPVCMI